MPAELRARRTELADDATGELLASGPRDADRPALYFSRHASRRAGRGSACATATERGRFLVPAALVAWLIALELALPWLFADLGRPGLGGRSRDLHPALELGRVLRRSCSAAASTRCCAWCWRRPGCCLAAATHRRS